MRIRKKLIEVALPLDAVNKASAREKSIRHGHPSTLHLWWARRPLATARAVIFAQMVDDPSEYVDVLLSDPKMRRAAKRRLRQRQAEFENRPAEAEGAGADSAPTLAEAAAELERERLFKLIEDLVQWENTTNEEVLERARTEIWQSWRRTCAENAGHPRARELFDRHKLPAFHDPFAGGGALPLEAQRLGLEAHASDLNPVAVLINKAMIEIPPKFAGRPPVNPAARSDATLVAKNWRGAQGLADDVRYYGKWMRDEAKKRIGHLYPKVAVTMEMARERPDLERYVGRELTVIAWLWARTVKSPNPAFAEVDVPLASTFMLSTKKGKEAYVEPVIEGRAYRFTVKIGPLADGVRAKLGTKSGGSGSPFLCLMSGSPMPFDYLRAEGKAGRLGSRLLAIVAEGDRERIYLPPTAAHEIRATDARPSWTPDTDLPPRALGFRVQEYGMHRWSDLFTLRQLVALTTFSDLVEDATARVRRDAAAPGLPENGRPLCDGGTAVTAYAEAVAVYLGLAVSRTTDTCNSFCRWQDSHARVLRLFGRQAIPMVWSFAEPNPFAGALGDLTTSTETVATALPPLGSTSLTARVQQADAQRGSSCVAVYSTDPPYYDNIGYADLSDFFYVWLRHCLKPIFPELFATLAVPKADELVATPYRHGSKKAAETFFLNGMTSALGRLREQGFPGFPVTIYYAFKQSERSGTAGTVSTGWETFLDAVIRSGFAITGTWPVKTELESRSVAIGTNALASSIVLVCRRRPTDPPVATRREFLNALRSELPQALRLLQSGNVAPVDLAQAAIGPGMAVYTRYAQVVDASGGPLSVRDALALINQTLDEVLAEQEGDFDADSRWALAWFEEHGFQEGAYGAAETLSKAKNTSVDGMVGAGILASRAGRVRLLRPEELPDTWDPTADARLTAWEMVHHLVRILESDGEAAAATLASSLGGAAEIARELCYRLYTVCDRKKRATAALSYNALVQSWPEISRLAQATTPGQPQLFGESD